MICRRVLVLFLSFFLSLPLSAQSPPADVGPETSEATEARPGGLASKLWWNQPAKIERLGLSEVQRERMDDLLRAFLEARSGSGEERRTSLVTLGEALAAGDREAALRQGDKLAELSADPVRRQVSMMADVMATLTPEQRKKLAAEYPRLLSRLWIRSAGPRLQKAMGRG